MKEEKSLVKTNNNIFSRMILSIKRFFSRNKEPRMSTELQDMKTLQQVMQGQVKINNLEESTIDRLIVLCSNRLKEVNKKIEYKKKEIYKNKKITTALKQM